MYSVGLSCAALEIGEERFEFSGGGKFKPIKWRNRVGVWTLYQSVLEKNGVEWVSFPLQGRTVEFHIIPVTSQNALSIYRVL